MNIPLSKPSDDEHSATRRRGILAHLDGSHPAPISYWAACVGSRLATS